MPAIARVIAILMLVACAHSPAPAGVEPAPLRHARLIPTNVDLAITLTDARSWRTGPAGAPALQLVETVLQAGEAGDAWTGFAKQLGLGPDEAFDRLLGTRATLARRVDGESPTWVLLSAIDRKTEKLLLTRLKPAPRGILGGLTIFAVEGGRFRMSIASIEDERTLVLGPADASALLDEVLPSIREARRRTIASWPVSRSLLASAPEADARMVIRSAQGSTSFGVALKTLGTEIAAAFAVDSAPLAEGYASTPEWDAAPLESLEPGAYLATMEWTPDLDMELPVFSGFELIDRLLNIRFDPSTTMNARRAVVVSPSPDGIASAVLMLETSDIGALARAGDEFVADSMTGLWPQGQAQPDDLNLAGAFPGAMRRLDLREALGLLALPLFATGPELAWRYVESGDAESPARGWWTIGLGADVVRRAGETLTDAQGREPALGRWVTRGVVRPRAALTEIRERRVPMPRDTEPYIRLLLRIEEARWSSKISADGLIVGWVRLDCIPAKD